MGVTRVGHSHFSSRSPSAVACPRGWGGELSATGCAWLGWSSAPSQSSTLWLWHPRATALEWSLDTVAGGC